MLPQLWDTKWGISHALVVQRYNKLLRIPTSRYWNDVFFFAKAKDTLRLPAYWDASPACPLPFDLATDHRGRGDTLHTHGH